MVPLATYRNTSYKIWYCSQPADIQNTYMILLATQGAGENERDTHQSRRKPLWSHVSVILFSIVGGCVEIPEPND